MMDLEKLLEQVEVYATKIVVEEFPHQLLYHNLKYIKRVVKCVDDLAKEENLSKSDTIQTKIAAWFVYLGFKDLDTLPRTDFESFFKSCNNCSLAVAKKFLETKEISEEVVSSILDTIREGGIERSPVTIKGKVLNDATTCDWSKGKAMQRSRQLYQQMLLLQLFKQGKSDFNDDMINYLNQHQYHTEYGKRALAPKKMELVAALQKEKKQFSKTEELLVQRELNISAEELKRLKKNLKSVEGRDDRGIQTMFRTTMRNHYTLNQMVDRKSNIMISINTIIISIIVSRIINNDPLLCIENVPAFIVLAFSLLSIIKAVLAIMPEQFHGRFTAEDIRMKRGNLLFFANFHKMKYDDYEWGMMEMMNDASFMYNSMIRDLYFLGIGLGKKYASIRRSLQVFMIGIVLGVISFLIFGNYHGHGG